MKARAVFLLLLAACQGKAADPAAKQQDPPLRAQTSDTLPPMPPYPEPARGRLAVQSTGGSHEIKGEWSAEAGLCERPPMLQVVSQVQGTGTIILLALPATNRVARYPVTLVGSGLPTPPAAQVGVQVFRPDGPAAYQAAEGSVEVYAFAKTVSGRFGVTLRQISTNAKIQYAGAFKEVAIKQMDPAHCAVADSAARR